MPMHAVHHFEMSERPRPTWGGQLPRTTTICSTNAMVIMPALRRAAPVESAKEMNKPPHSLHHVVTNAFGVGIGGACEGHA
jgi:hypothetical protein